MECPAKAMEGKKELQTGSKRSIMGEDLNYLLGENLHVHKISLHFLHLVNQQHKKALAIQFFLHPRKMSLPSN